MEPDPPSATGISPSVAQRVMQQRPDDQRSRVRRLARPTIARPAQAGKVNQRQSSPAECENPRLRGTTSGME
jgi:hypothetical protein